MNKAFIFPGQGSQAIGMGKDFFNSFPVAKQTFEEVDEALGVKLSQLIFDGNIEELTLTSNAQPAIMVTSIAILKILLEKTGKTIDQLCSYVAGHSLGEYTALCATGALTLRDTAQLLKLRGKAMQESYPSGGAMAACLGIELPGLEDIILSNNLPGDVCDIANDNCDGQIVISGTLEAIERVVAILKDLRYKALKLNVSGPFHSRLMKPAEEMIAMELEKIQIKAPLIPVISNYDASATKDPLVIKGNLVAQMCNMVRWRQTMDNLAALGIKELVEMGPGKVLGNLAKKTGNDFEIMSISNINDFEEYLNKI